MTKAIENFMCNYWVLVLFIPSTLACPEGTSSSRFTIRNFRILHPTVTKTQQQQKQEDQTKPTHECTWKFHVFLPKENQPLVACIVPDPGDAKKEITVRAYSSKFKELKKKLAWEKLSPFLFSGYVISDPGSWIFGTVNKGGFVGQIYTRNQIYYIEDSKKYLDMTKLREVLNFKNKEAVDMSKVIFDERYLKEICYGIGSRTKRSHRKHHEEYERDDNGGSDDNENKFAQPDDTQNHYRRKGHHSKEPRHQKHRNKKHRKHKESDPEGISDNKPEKMREGNPEIIEGRILDKETRNVFKQQPLKGDEQDSQKVEDSKNDSQKGLKQVSQGDSQLNPQGNLERDTQKDSRQDPQIVLQQVSQGEEQPDTQGEEQPDTQEDSEQNSQEEDSQNESATVAALQVTALSDSQSGNENDITNNGDVQPSNSLPQTKALVESGNQPTDDFQSQSIQLSQDQPTDTNSPDVQVQNTGQTTKWTNNGDPVQDPNFNPLRNSENLPPSNRQNENLNPEIVRISDSNEPSSKLFEAENDLKHKLGLDETIIISSPNESPEDPVSVSATRKHALSYLKSLTRGISLFVAADYKFFKNVGDENPAITLGRILYFLDRVEWIIRATAWHPNDLPDNIGFDIKQIAIEVETAKDSGKTSFDAVANKLTTSINLGLSAKVSNTDFVLTTTSADINPQHSAVVVTVVDAVGKELPDVIIIGRILKALLNALGSTDTAPVSECILNDRTVWTEPFLFRDLNVPQCYRSMIEPALELVTHEATSVAYCGNGVLEPGEDCDCGSLSQCWKYGNACCNPRGNSFKQCKLTSGSQCYDPLGICCNTSCQVKDYLDEGLNCMIQKCDNDDEQYGQEDLNSQELTGLSCGALIPETKSRIQTNCYEKKCQSDECSRLGLPECTCPIPIYQHCSSCCFSKEFGCLASDFATEKVLDQIRFAFKSWKTNQTNRLQFGDFLKDDRASFRMWKRLCSFNIDDPLKKYLDDGRIHMKQFCIESDCVNLNFLRWQEGGPCVIHGVISHCSTNFICLPNYQIFASKVEVSRDNLSNKNLNISETSSVTIIHASYNILSIISNVIILLFLQ